MLVLLDQFGSIGCVGGSLKSYLPCIKAVNPICGFKIAYFLRKFLSLKIILSGLITFTNGRRASTSIISIKSSLPLLPLIRFCFTSNSLGWVLSPKSKESNSSIFGRKSAKRTLNVLSLFRMINGSSHLSSLPW